MKCHNCGELEAWPNKDGWLPTHSVYFEHGSWFVRFEIRKSMHIRALSAHSREEAQWRARQLLSNMLDSWRRDASGESDPATTTGSPSRATRGSEGNVAELVDVARAIKVQISEYESHGGLPNVLVQNLLSLRSFAEADNARLKQVEEKLDRLLELWEPQE